MAPRNDPALKAEICRKMNERFNGDVAVKDVDELLNLLSIDAAIGSRGKQKRAVGSLIYNTRNITRYHDKAGERHFKVVKPFTV